MAIKDNFASKGLYRLWVVFFWLWVGGFLFLGGPTFVKHEYTQYEENNLCNELAKAEGRTGDLNLICGLKLKRGEIQAPHSASKFILIFVLGLIGPPFLLYYFYRISHWIRQGFRD